MHQSGGDVVEFFKQHPLVRYVLYVFHDYGNIPRCIASTKARTVQLALLEEYDTIGSVSNIGYCSWGLSRHEDEWVKVMKGSDHWIPCWQTLRVGPRTDTAVVLCSTKQPSEPVHRWFDRDPRTVLSKVVARAENEFDLDFKVGYEIEFHLLPGGCDLATANPNPGPSGAYNLSATNETAWDVVMNMVGAIECAGISIWNFHPELDADEFEISLAPNEPLNAVDDLLHSINIIRSIAKAHGMRATMHPQRYPDAPTIGMHAHISLSNADMAEHFLAGMLGHLRGISAILLGGYDSFGARDTMLGHGDISWGTAKNCTIRKFGSNRFEIRPPDALGNPYLQLASIIGTGMIGVKALTPLLSLENTWRNPEPMDDATRRRLAITDRLPTTLEEAVNAMEEDSDLRVILGDLCYDAFMQYKKGELVRAERRSRVERTRRLVEHI